MVDHLSKAARSTNMSRIKGRNTAPELLVRRLLHQLGYRFKLSLKGLPGRPDIIFPNRKKAIFVNGCFWHQHQDCVNARLPKSNEIFWRQKLERNIQRDAEVTKRLADLGWSCFTIWECEVKRRSVLQRDLVKFLGPTKYRSTDYRPER